jgi:hypothetical protein
MGEMLAVKQREIERLLKDFDELREFKLQEL